MPLRIDTSKGGGWGKWNRKYPTQGNGIPVIYIIRADGEMLYGKSGNPQGAGLPRLLEREIKRSGTILTDKELKLLGDVSMRAKLALKKKNWEAVAKQIRRAKKIGKLGATGSYAKAAMQVDKMVGQLVAHATEQMNSLQEHFETKPADWKTALALVKTYRLYGHLPPLKKPMLQLVSLAKKSDGGKSLLKQAAMFDKVHLLLASEKNGTKKAAIALQRFLEAYPSSPGAPAAKEWLGKLQRKIALAAPSTKEGKSSDSSTLKEEPMPAADSFRTWKFKDGRKSLEAKLLDVENSKAVLKTKAGKTVKIPLDELTKADLLFIEDNWW